MKGPARWLRCSPKSSQLMDFLLLVGRTLDPPHEKRPVDDVCDRLFARRDLTSFRMSCDENADRVLLTGHEPKAGRTPAGIPIAQGGCLFLDFHRRGVLWLVGPFTFKAHLAQHSVRRYDF